MQEHDAARHLPALDGVRGIAILTVMLFHQTVFVPQSALEFGVYYALSGGWIGVDIFFVLSGFLITGILLDSRNDQHFFKSFYMRRVLRIFPLFYALAIFSFVILPWLPLPATKAARFDTVGDDQWMYWVFLSNFAIAKVDLFRHGIMDVTWSVAIEEQFYLVWPALVFLFRRRTLAILCCAILAVSPVLRALAIWEFGLGYTSAYVLTPLRLDGLAMGALLAMIVRSPPHLALITTRNAVLLAVTGSAIFIAAAVASGGADLFGAYVQPIGLSGAMLLAAGCLIGALSSRPDSPYRAFLMTGWMRALGKYSYCLYLIHLPIRAALRDLVLKPIDYPGYPGGALVGQLVFYVVALTITLAIAWLSYHLYEKQFLKLKRYFPYR